MCIRDRDIDLSHVSNNPMISGVIITPLGDPPVASNTAPVFDSISDRSVTTDGTLEFTASATDADGDSLTYSVLTEGLPGSPEISAQLGRFSWTPPSSGTFNITLQASDGELTDTETFRRWAIENLPAACFEWFDSNVIFSERFGAFQSAVDSFHFGIRDWLFVFVQIFNLMNRRMHALPCHATCKVLHHIPARE